MQAGYLQPAQTRRALWWFSSRERVYPYPKNMKRPPKITISCLTDGETIFPDRETILGMGKPSNSFTHVQYTVFFRLCVVYELGVGLSLGGCTFHFDGAEKERMFLLKCTRNDTLIEFPKNRARRPEPEPTGADR
jgi:hypothetical protein